MDERTTAKFLRGLTLGALLGAIIAGSRSTSETIVSKAALP